MINTLVRLRYPIVHFTGILFYHFNTSIRRPSVNNNILKIPKRLADLKEEIIDEYLNREGLQEIKKMLYHPGYIPNTELPAVYSGASVFIYTSLRESFGIPILEAMACGTPVITSTTSAMPEIAGPEGILVNPFEPEEIASALLHLEENAEFYQSQTAYGLERVRRFSWENTAREILNIYKEILA